MAGVLDDLVEEQDEEAGGGLLDDLVEEPRRPTITLDPVDLRPSLGRSFVAGASVSDEADALAQTLSKRTPSQDYAGGGRMREFGGANAFRDRAGVQATDPETFGADYDAELVEARRRQDEARAANPKAAIAGSVAEALATAPLVPGGTLTQSTILGAGQGLANSKREDLGQTIKDTGEGGAFGLGGGVAGKVVGGVGGAVVRKGKEAFGRSAKYAGEGFEEHGKRMAAKQAEKTAKLTKQAAEGEGAKQWAKHPLTPKVDALEKAIRKVKRARRKLVANGADDADEAVKEASKKIRTLNAKKAEMMERRAESPVGGGRSMSKAGRQKFESFMEGKAAKGDGAQLELQSSGNLVESALGGIESTVGGLGSAVTAPILGFSLGGPAGVLAGFLGREAAKRALSSPKLAQAAADRLMSVAARSQVAGLYAPVLTEGIEAGTATGAREMLQRHLMLMDADPVYREEIERIEQEDAEADPLGMAMASPR